jgi:DnaJ like chaperone protein
MSIWGKVIGGVAGFAIGGPLGAILGAVAGHHAVDKGKASEAGGFPGADNNDRQVAFTTAVIVLCAKMAKSDGQVTTDEIAAFKRIFQIPPEEQESVGRLFNEARQEATGFEPYAQQIATLFAHQPAVMEEILGALFVIARADGTIHPAELDFVEKTSRIFGFSPSQFEQLKAIHLGGGEAGSDAYEVLGLDRDASDADVKKTYRKLIREYHPDTLIAQGMPQEFIDLANDKMAAINAAYDQIEKERGLK